MQDYLNQNKIKYQTEFSARSEKLDEVDQVLDNSQIYINLKINLKLTESDIDNINVRLQSERQIQNQESNDSYWDLIKLFQWKYLSTKRLDWMVQFMQNFCWDLQLQ